jgi:AraC-like DNA-binding protein
MGLPSPEHPKISVIDLSDLQISENTNPFMFTFYAIAIKPDFKGKMRYGQSEYDFDEGMMTFVAPHQVISFQNEIQTKLSGWLMLIHPDFLWNSPLAQTIKQYDYFTYRANEALFLSDKEQKMMIDIFQTIREEYHTRIDKFSKEIITAQVELLLKYAQRFYDRQFILREKPNHLVLSRLEDFVSEYINGKQGLENGIPTVQSASAFLNISPNYLSRLLQSLTGQTTQQYLQDKLIEMAKIRLSTTGLSVSQIAYELGFEHPQSFSKLFKKKTNLTPLVFRSSFD